MPSGTQERLDSVQMLRAIAALAVIWSHSTLELLRFTDVDLRTFSSLSSMGRIGVDIFFVISGFVMVYVSSRHFQKTGEVSRFVLRRIIRVVPVYWFYTSLMLGVALFAPDMLRNFKLSWFHVAASYLFIPWATPGDNDFHPLLGIGWTLNYEMFFYILFAPFLLFARERAVLALVGLFYLHRSRRPISGTERGGAVVLVPAHHSGIYVRRIVGASFPARLAAQQVIGGSCDDDRSWVDRLCGGILESSRCPPFRDGCPLHTDCRERYAQGSIQCLRRNVSFSFGLYPPWRRFLQSLSRPYVCHKSVDENSLCGCSRCRLSIRLYGGSFFDVRSCGYHFL